MSRFCHIGFLATPWTSAPVVHQEDVRSDLDGQFEALVAAGHLDEDVPLAVAERPRCTGNDARVLERWSSSGSTCTGSASRRTVPSMGSPASFMRRTRPTTP